MGNECRPERHGEFRVSDVKARDKVILVGLDCPFGEVCVVVMRWHELDGYVVLLLVLLYFLGNFIVEEIKGLCETWCEDVFGDGCDHLYPFICGS